MHEESNFRKKAENFFAGKGFYIVLILCIAVIGASAWIILSSSGVLADKDGAAQDVSVSVDADAALAQEPVIGRKPETQTPADGDGQRKDDSAADDGSAETPPETGDETPDAAGIGTDDGADAAGDGAQETQAPAEEQPVFLRPVNGPVSFDYSVDALVYNKTMADWRTHSGMDIEAELGTRVMAAADGVVKAVGEDDFLGTTVVIEHAGGLCTIYANLAAVPTVSAGDSVSAGDVIGSVGDTAVGESSEVTHLHFAMTLDGQSVNPADYLSR